MKIIENYIYLLDGRKQVVVLWKKHKQVCVIEVGENYPTAIVDIDRLSGVPLTEEIFLKCGFVRDKDFNTVLKIKIETLNGNHVIFIDTRANVLLVGNIEISDFNYLHELQNLIYSLTKTELNYENTISKN